MAKPQQRVSRSSGNFLLNIFSLRRSVGGRIFLTFFISIVLFVLAAGWISAVISERIIKEKVSDAFQQTLIQTSDKLDMVYEQLEANALHFNDDRDLNQNISNYLLYPEGSFEKGNASSQLDERITALRTGGLRAVHLYYPNGDLLRSFGMSSVQGNYAEEEWFKAAIENRGEVYWGSTKQDGYHPTTNNTFAISKLVTDNTTNRDMVVVLIEYDISSLLSRLELIDFGESGEVYILDKNNQIVSSFNEEEIEMEFQFALDTDVKQFSAIDHENKERLVVYDESASGNGWKIVGTVLVDELVQDAAQIRAFTFVIAFFAALLAAIIGILIARSIGGPLIHMSALMEEGAQGKLGVRTNFRSLDEIGRLGASFDVMMEQIANLVKQTNESAQNVLATASQLSEVSRQTAMSAKEISVASEQIASGATTLSMEAERGNELTQGISQQMRKVVESNLEMGNSANEVRQSSEQGVINMNIVTEKTMETEAMTRSMVEKVNKLKDSTSSIRQILELLDGITKQTNILSLNATIEAARAGAAGRGFMVVADEIRKLADQSKESIEIVGEITEAIQNEIDETVAVLSEAYPLFQEQTQTIKEADAIFHNVQDKMQQFIHHLDEVTSSIQQLEESQTVLSEAMTNVSAVSQQSSATSEEVASLTIEQLKVSDGLVKLSEQLEALSESLKESLARFTV